MLHQVVKYDDGLFLPARLCLTFMPPDCARPRPDGRPLCLTARAWPSYPCLACPLVLYPYVGKRCRAKLRCLASASVFDSSYLTALPCCRQWSWAKP
eukprot:1161515-Pelagomonas_calceolata.AAC.6